MIEAKIILDSINTTGNRLTTWILKYPRFILAELNTHRCFSRNSASSRSLPIKTMLNSVMNEPAMPVFWGKNQSGMQAAEELSPTQQEEAKKIWLEIRNNTLLGVKKLLDLGLHKQTANRPLEPWFHMTTLVSGTEWENFFALRAHKDAQPEFQELAYKMLDLYIANKPQKLKGGEWHIPFGDKMLDGLSNADKLKVCTARAARLSYLTFDGEFDIQKDIELHDRLFQSGHFSPFEHCACSTPGINFSGNFKGWIQYRKTLVGENRSDERINQTEV